MMPLLLGIPQLATPPSEVGHLHITALTYALEQISALYVQRYQRLVPIRCTIC